MSAPTIPNCRSLCDGAAQLLCGIALEEAGLAHVINAEGEKIQRAIQLTQSIDDLVRANRSVKEVLEVVVKKNFTLVLKLEQIEDLLRRCPVCPEG